MTQNNRRPAWKTYMLSGNKGAYYILSRPENTYYGPFKNKEYAEFFNLLAFCSPRAIDVKGEASGGVVFSKEKPETTDHPRNMFASNSPFSVWLYDLYGKQLTTKLVLELAKASGAKGYESFINWMIDGSRINGVHLSSAEL